MKKQTWAEHTKLEKKINNILGVRVDGRIIATDPFIRVKHKETQILKFLNDQRSI